MKKLPLYLFFLWLIIVVRIGGLLFNPVSLKFSEAFKATAAYDLITERRFDFFDYTYRHSEGGGLVTVLLAAVMFKLFGVSVFSFRLSPLFISICAFSIGHLLVRRYFGVKKAAIFSLLFIFAPTGYIGLSLTGFGNHAESILFFFSLLFCLSEIYSEKEQSGNRKGAFSALLGFVCGVSICYAYFNMITVMSCIFYMFVYKRNSFKLNESLRFFIFFAIGLLPILIYRVTYAHGGEWLIHSKPLYTHFFANNLQAVAAKISSLLISDLPLSLFSGNNVIFLQKMLGYSYGIIFICLLLFNWKYKRRFFAENEGAKVIVEFVFIYLIFFVVTYALSDFTVRPNNGYCAYRYILAILPVFFLLLMCYFDSESKKIRWLFNYAGIFMLLILSVIGMSNLMQNGGFRQSLEVNPINYKSFGWSIADKFDYDFEKCLSYAGRLIPQKRGDFFWGLGDRHFEKLIKGRGFEKIIENSGKFRINCRKIPEKYKMYFYIGVSNAFTEEWHWDDMKDWRDINDSLRLLEKIIIEEDKKYVYEIVGGQVAVRRWQEIPEVSACVNEEYRDDYYTGVGAGILFFTDFDIKKANEIIVNKLLCSEKDKNDCFLGMCDAILFVPSEQRKSFCEMLIDRSHLIDKKYKSAFLRELKKNCIWRESIIEYSGK